MSFEGINSESTKSYDSMSIWELEADPIAGPVLQREAHKYLLTSAGNEWFLEKYEDKLSPDNFLIERDGSVKSMVLPTKCLGGLAYEPVEKATKKELARVDSYRLENGEMSDVPRELKEYESWWGKRFGGESSPEDLYRLNDFTKRLIRHDDAFKALLSECLFKAISEGEKGLADEKNIKWALVEALSTYGRNFHLVVDYF